MSWENPVTTWGHAGQTVPKAGDFNRIEGNTLYLKDEVDTHKAISASTTTKGHVQLSSSTSSTSTSLAATASAVKTVNDALTSHLSDYAYHGELIAFPGYYIDTEFDTPTPGNITETMKKSVDDSVFLTRITEFDVPAAGNITVTLNCPTLSINNKVVTQFDTPDPGKIRETASEVV